MFRTTDNISVLREKVDVVKLQNYLSEAAPEITAPIKLQQFLHGQSNPTLLLTDAGGAQFVLRKKPPGELLSLTAHAVEREHRVMNALQGTDLPVPKMYCLCHDKSIIGTPFYIMEFLRGRIFTNPAMPNLSEADRRTCWYSAIETLARLHAIQPASVGLADYGKPTGFYTRQLKTFQKLTPVQSSTVDSETGKCVGSIPQWQELTSWLAENLPVDRTSIVHGDFKIDNCVFHDYEPRVIGILDWELSTIGHPLSDLANLLQPYGLPNDGGSSLTGFIGGNVAGLPTLLEAQDHYATIAGWQPQTDWTFAETFAHLRLAVISQGIAARVARKQASSLKAVHHAQLFGPLGELAWSIIQSSRGREFTKAKI